MKKIILILLFLTFIISGFLFLNNRKQEIISPLGKEKKELPLEKYSFAALQKTKFEKSTLKLGKVLKNEKDYVSQMFYLNVKSPLINSGKISGLINVPQKEGIYPVIVLFRGFVPKEAYQTGVGTNHAGEFFASNNFITISPDFLGYGESDNPSNDSMEERFQTYTTALGLLASLQSLNTSLDASYSGRVQADISKIGIWGHSNGGHIALSILAISGKSYPTVLWAPVSKPFPYSILFFTDDFDDHGKALRKVLAKFEKDYDAEKYSPTNFYKWINAPLQIHQGEDDDAVPKRWSDTLFETLKELDKDVTYFTYLGSDHNLSPSGWGMAIERSSSFYNTYFK